MKKFFFGTCAFGLAILMIMAACSKSTKSNIDTEAMAESLKDQTDILINNLGAFIGEGLAYVNYGISGTPKPADTSYYVYDDFTGWWTHVRQMSMIDPYVWTINELDSIRFSAGEIHQMQPDETTDGLEFRIIGDETLQFAVDSVMTMDVDFGCIFANANLDTIDIDGDFYFDLGMVMGNFEFSYFYDCNYNDIRMVNDPYSYENYPISGNMVLALDFMSTGDPTNEIPAGEWEVLMTLTFNPNGYHGEMTIEGDHFSWDAIWDDISQAPVYGGR